MGTLNSSIISGISNGLLNTYSAIANASGSKGVTLSSIKSATTNPNCSNTLNQSFVAYLQSNFNTFDKNHDGKITPDEMQQTSNLLTTTGMTQTQLTQLGAASGLSSDDISKILSHFSDIDTNKDGKVTMAEINAYNITSSKMKKEDEFREKAASSMSLFYGSESSSSETASSLLSYKYLENEK